MIGTDYVGLGALVGATGAAIVSIIVALRQTGTKQQVDEVHAAVSMSNGLTLGQVVEKVDKQTNGSPPAPEVPK